MPKQKTHKASKKRFKITGTGKRKRQLRHSVIEMGIIAKKYIKVMGG